MLMVVGSIMVMKGRLMGLLHMGTLMAQLMLNNILNLLKGRNRGLGSRLLSKEWDISIFQLLNDFDSWEEMLSLKRAILTILVCNSLKLEAYFSS